MMSVSVIIPTYNRADFVARALESVRGQLFTEWSLIVVDDGSTDNTPAVVAEFAKSVSQDVTYVRQTNQGAYAARNAGSKLARGSYIALLDSDDEWLPHHLKTCVAVLDAHADVDWVYAASRIIDDDTRRTLSPNSFYHNGAARPFLSLRHERRGDLHVINDPKTLERALEHSLCCGLQNSVTKTDIIKALPFSCRFRNAEDQIMPLRALYRGVRFAYFNRPHVLYHIHSDNLSAASRESSLSKKTYISHSIVGHLEDIKEQLLLSRSEAAALSRRLARVKFWQLGYSVHWMHGEDQKAIEEFQSALRLWPWSITCWKTYLVCLIRTRSRLLLSWYRASIGKMCENCRR